MKMIISVFNMNIHFSAFVFEVAKLGGMIHLRFANNVIKQYY